MQGYVPLTQPGKLKVTVLDGSDLEGHALYVILELGSQRYRTITSKGYGRQVVWNDSCEFRVGMSTEITMLVKSEYSVSWDNELGTADVSILKVIQQGKLRTEVPLYNNSHESRGTINVLMEFEAAVKPKPVVSVPIARDLRSESLDDPLFESSLSLEDRWELTSNGAPRPPRPHHHHRRHHHHSHSLNNTDPQHMRPPKSRESPRHSQSMPGSPGSVRSSRSSRSRNSGRSSSSNMSIDGLPPREPRPAFTPRSAKGPQVERFFSEDRLPKAPASERSLRLDTKSLTDVKPRVDSNNKPRATHALGASTPRVTLGASVKVPFGSATPRSCVDLRVPSTPHSVAAGTPRSAAGTPRSMLSSTPKASSANNSLRASLDSQLSLKRSSTSTPKATPALWTSQSHSFAPTPKASATPKAAPFSSVKRMTSKDDSSLSKSKSSTRAGLLTTAPAGAGHEDAQSDQASFVSRSTVAGTMTKVASKAKSSMSFSSRRCSSMISAETPKRGAETPKRSGSVSVMARPVWRM